MRAVHDALGDLYHLVQEGAAGDESPRVLERYHRAIAAVTSLAALSAKKNGAPRGEPNETPEAAPDAGALERDDGLGGERGIRTPDTLAGTPDFESATSLRAAQAVRLAWELVDKQTAPRLAAWFLEQLDEHDPITCEAICCNAPLALEVRP